MPDLDLSRSLLAGCLAQLQLPVIAKDRTGQEWGCALQNLPQGRPSSMFGKVLKEVHLLKWVNSQ